MSRDTREKRDRHALNEEGMVLCNPRDREAAHRAEMEGIATDCSHDSTASLLPKDAAGSVELAPTGWHNAPPSP